MTLKTHDCDYEIIIVSYRSRAPLSRLLDVLDGEKVVVVDNAARTDPVRDLTSAHGARYLDPGENVGFAAAANLGAESADAEVMIFVNPDCLPTRPVLAELADCLCRDRSLGSCSPRLTGTDGETSTVGGGWRPTLPRCIAQAMGLPKVLKGTGIWVTPRQDDVLEVGWLAGTCLAVRRSAFRSVGGFDTKFFLYNEDMALGERLGSRGLRQVLRADLAVEHAGGQSSSGSQFPVWLLRAASMAGYIRDRNSPGAALSMRIVLSLGWSLRAAVCLALPSRRRRVTELVTYVVGIMRPAWATARARSALVDPVRDENGMAS
jgi:N-acetylglucosaminyl-diphospho-decaprenol L-rhamnosyltransferase